MITSTANSQIRHLIQLQKRGKLRKEEGLFVAEGVKMYLEAPQERLLKTYVSESFYSAHRGDDIWRGEPMEVVVDHVFEAASDTRTPQGILSVVRQAQYSLEEVIGGVCPLLLVIENLQDPGNLGTIIRTGEGAGVTGIVLSQNTVDLYNPKTIRSTMGSVYRMPVCCARDMGEVVVRMRERGITSYAAHLGGTQDYDGVDYRGGAAFLIGNEGNGLSEKLASAADLYIRIPMQGRVESLNAAIASAILMYEAYRQRKRS